MKVLVEFIGYAVRKIGREWLWVELAEGGTLHDVVSRFASTLDASAVESLKAALSTGELRIAVNGRLVDSLGLKLSDGDKILVFPIAAGG
ncbi:MoaD/ThiS family protein [Candidatus Bathyarchaeota archaeon]|nr:MoaD/ThiS family protein [Candidatus Bathyarchaeota archaeon]